METGYNGSSREGGECEKVKVVLNATKGACLHRGGATRLRAACLRMF